MPDDLNLNSRNGASQIDENDVLNTAEAAAYLNLSTSNMNKMRVSGNGPDFYKVFRAVRYRRSDLDRWLMQFRVRSTLEAEAMLSDRQNAGHARR